jgi:outer membrane protein TolC
MWLSRIVFIFALSSSLFGGEPCLINLCQAEKMALCQNQLIRIRQQEVIGSVYQKEIAFSRWLPQVAIDAMYNRFEHSPYPPPPQKEFYLNVVDFEQLLFSPDNYYDVVISGIDIGRSCIELAQEQNDVLLDVRRRYFSVVLARLNLQAGEEQIRAFLEAIRAMREGAGAVQWTKLDEAQASTYYHIGLAQYYDLVDTLQTQENDFMESIGVSPECRTSWAVADCSYPIMEIDQLAEKVALANAFTLQEEDRFMETGELPCAWRHGLLPDDGALLNEAEIHCWSRVALCYSPEIRQSCLNLRRTQAELAKDWGRYLPTISFFGQFQANPFGGYATGLFSDMFWNAGISFNWTLFDGFGRENRIGQTRSRRRAACIDVERQVLLSNIDVRNEVVGVASYAFEYAAAVRGAEVAAVNFELAREAWFTGTMDTLDYVTTIFDFYRTRIGRNVAGFQLLDAYYSLRHAVGIDIPMWSACQ